jgi:hypothetical protein
LVDWLLGDHLLLRDFYPYVNIFMNVCVVITVAMVMLWRDFGPYGILFMTVCVYYFNVPVILDGKFTSLIVIGYSIQKQNASGVSAKYDI